MTIRGSVMLLEIDLCGRTEAPLTYSSSLMVTSSPRTVMFSTRVYGISACPRNQALGIATGARLHLRNVANIIRFSCCCISDSDRLHMRVTSTRACSFLTPLQVCALHAPRVCEKREQTYPSADIAVPPNDTVSDPSVIPDDSVRHDDAALQADTGANLGAGTNDDVGAEHGRRVNLGRLLWSALARRIQSDLEGLEESRQSQIQLTGSTKTLPPYTHLFCEGSDSRGECCEVRCERYKQVPVFQSSSPIPIRLSGTVRSLPTLSNHLHALTRIAANSKYAGYRILTGDKVLGLTNVHPEPSKVVRVQLLVGGNGGEDLLLDRSGTELLRQYA